MPEYLSPGVYVEETDTGSKTIEGVSTSTAGFVGMTKRGPTEGLPVLVTSFADFQRKFGGHFDFGVNFKHHNYLPYAVEGFFTNGGKRLYIKRVLGTGATKASVVTQVGIVTRLAADSTGTTVKVASVRGIVANTNIRVRMLKNNMITDSVKIKVNKVDPVAGTLTLDAALPSVYEARYSALFTDINLDPPNTDPLGARLPSFTITAKEEGSWGRSISIQTFHESAARSEFDGLVGAPAADDTNVRLKSGAGFYAGAWVEIENGATRVYRQVISVSGNVIKLKGAAMIVTDFDATAPITTTRISTCEFGMIVSYEGVVEQYSGMTLEPINGRYYHDKINNASQLITVTPPAGATSPTFFPTGDGIPAGGFRSPSEGLHLPLTTGGIDGSSAPNDTAYKGVDNGPGKRSGIKALEDIDQISIIAAPGITTQAVQGALIEQCELLKDRFAILDPENKQQGIQEIITQRLSFDTKYAAIYYPRIVVDDPFSDTDIVIPPSGHMAGIYARTDIERGVHKAPANEVIRGINDLDLKISRGEQDILNPLPYNVNVLRDFRADGRGFRVWGGRCITSDSDWKYINVRRLFIFIEESIDQGTQWVVFEPNDEPLWARVRRSVGNFLTNVWRDGALQGRKPEEAFFVRCDRTTMTQDDIDNGRLIMVIGIAPVKPAEFVIFRIGQWTGGSSVEEG